MPSPSPSSRTVLTLLAFALATPVAAQGYRGAEPYGPALDGAYGYAGEFVRGNYIGAPLTRVPSTLNIVPTPWSYGTYGIPTVSGIPPSPVAQPTITRINASRSRSARWTESDRAAGARVIEVRVPSR